MPSFLDLPHLLAFLTGVARLTVWLLLLGLIFVPLEQLFALHPRKFFSKSLARDVGYFFINGLLPGVLLAVPLSLVAYGAHAIMPDQVQLTVAALPLWQRVLAGLVVAEIGFYWGHRWMHQIPFLWEFHAIHHDAKEVYFLVSARAHPFDNAFIKLCGIVPVSVLGIATPLTPAGGAVSALLVLALTTWGFWIHANLKWRLGPLEWVISTPAFHHWHHTHTDHKDHNYASMLPWIDRIFGTYYLPRNQWPAAYGIPDTLPGSLVGQLVYPLRSAPPNAGPPEPVVANPREAS